jgi:hypothetical protein
VPRPLRWIPEGGALVEVTCRTLHGRFLLKPSLDLNEIILGVLGRGQSMYEVGISALAFASNHYHMLLRVKDAEQLSNFMGYVNSNLAREAGRLVDWREKFWSRRYRSIVISDEEEAQVARLKYVLSHGVKENLVSRVLEWPGVNGLRHLLYGEPLTGYWFDRSQEYAARQRGESFERLSYATLETVQFKPLPCWEGLSPDQARTRMAALVAEIEHEAEVARRGSEPAGVTAVLSQDPHSHPRKPKKSSAPRFHAFRHEIRLALYDAYSLFLGLFRDAAEKWKLGDRQAHFPTGSFPPGLPFVRAG